MKPFLREPLLHFTFLGAALFLIHGMLNDPRGGTSAHDRPQIRVTEGDIRWLAETWSRQWQREPSPEEMTGLVSDYVREQMLAHEARALGLDENDTVIRRRLAQKVEFLVRDTAVLAEPAEEELRAFHASQAGRYRQETRLSFRQLYFNPDRRTDAPADAVAALEILGREPDRADALGDTSLLGTEFLEVEEHVIRSTFGEAFGSKLSDAPVGAWSGPLESAYGFHLVFLEERRPGADLPYEAVRERVQNDWAADRQRLAHEAYFQALLQKYDVVMDGQVEAAERPKSDSGGHAI